MVTTPSGELGQDRWTRRTVPGGSELTWRAPAALPVTDARPEFRSAGMVLGYPRLDRHGRTLRLRLRGNGSSDLALPEVWLGARRLDASTPPARSSEEQPPAAAVVPDGDPGVLGPHATKQFDYTDAPVEWPAFAAPMEMLGHAVLPVDTVNAPLVVFLHGRHTACYGTDEPGFWPCTEGAKPVPSYRGYTYLQRVLGSQGYASISISANAVNGQDWNTPDGGARARAALVRRHLRLLAQWSSDGSNAIWADRLDLQRVVLVGHSRGGEGVNQAAIDTGPSAPYGLAGQILLAPTNFGYQTAPYLPTEVVLPYCDGDVYDLQGQRYVDAARLLDDDDPSLRASVLLQGANHNFFNTEWTPSMSAAPSFDDWWEAEDPVCGRKVSPTRLTSAEQRRAAVTFVAAGVHAFFGRNAAEALRYLDAEEPVAVAAAGPAVAWTHALGGRRDTASLGAGAATAGSAQACVAGQTTGLRTPPLCGVEDYYFRQVHWTPTYRWPASVHAAYVGSGLPRHASVAWTAPGQQGGLALDHPMNLSSSDARLDLRVIVEPARGPVQFRIVLGSEGKRWVGPVTSLSPFPGASTLAPVWGQTVRVNAGDYRRHVDITRVDTVLVRGVSPTGQVWIVDVSRRRSGLENVPDISLPRIRLGRVVQVESADGVAHLPFRVLGASSSSGAFAVAAEQSTFGFLKRPALRTVRIAAGQTSGSIPVPYEADALDDPHRQTQLVYAVAKRGVVLSGFVGRTVITDDDPPPLVRFTPAASTAAYGETITYRLTLSTPVDYDIFNVVRAVRPAGSVPLRTSDVPQTWFVQRFGKVPADVPIARVWRYGFLDLPAGATSARLRVPTRRHPLHSWPKTLTLRFTAPQLTDPLLATVRVAPFE